MPVVSVVVGGQRPEQPWIPTEGCVQSLWTVAAKDEEEKRNGHLSYRSDGGEG